MCKRKQNFAWIGGRSCRCRREQHPKMGPTRADSTFGSLKCFEFANIETHEAGALSEECDSAAHVSGMPKTEPSLLRRKKTNRYHVILRGMKQKSTRPTGPVDVRSCATRKKAHKCPLPAVRAVCACGMEWLGVCVQLRVNLSARYVA